MSHLIERLIPNIDDFHTYEYHEGTRIVKSAASKRRLREFKKLKARQEAKEEKLHKEKMREKQDKEKRRVIKQLTKHQEEQERQDRYKNRRTQSNYRIKLPTSK